MLLESAIIIRTYRNGIASLTCIKCLHDSIYTGMLNVSLLCKIYLLEDDIMRWTDMQEVALNHLLKILSVWQKSILLPLVHKLPIYEPNWQLFGLPYKTSQYFKYMGSFKLPLPSIPHSILQFLLIQVTFFDCLIYLIPKRSAGSSFFFFLKDSIPVLSKLISRLLFECISANFLIKYARSFSSWAITTWLIIRVAEGLSIFICNRYSHVFTFLSSWL